jgi:hypothetical protein
VCYKYTDTGLFLWISKVYGDLYETNLLETVLNTLGICILETNDQSKLRPDEYSEIIAPS